MRKIKQLTCLLLAAGMTVSAFAGCGGNQTIEKGENDILISCWVSAYGEEYITEIVDRFNEINTDGKAILEKSSSASTVASTLSLGAQDTTDVYVNMLDVMYSYADQFEDMSGILNENAYGEEKKVSEKIDSTLLRAATFSNGSFKYLPHAGSLTGIVYNADIIDGEKHQVPKTSDQLELLCSDLADTIKPFIHFDVDNCGYYSYLLRPWVAQYCGLDYYYNNLLMLTDEQGNSPSKAVFMNEKDGRKAALEELASIIPAKYVVAGSNTDSYTSAQTKLINGRAAMMVTGAWLQSEMGQAINSDANFSIMRTPVISAIVEQCPSVSNNDDEEELVALITKIDDVIDGKATVELTGDDTALVEGEGFSVTEKDWKHVYSARTLSYNNGSELVMTVNKYSKAKDTAKEFVKFFYSDEAQKIFVKNTHLLPVTNLSDMNGIDTNAWSKFEQNIFSEQQKLTYLADGVAKHDVLVKSGLDLYANQPMIKQFSGNDPELAATVWERTMNKIERSWDSWLNA